MKCVFKGFMGDMGYWDIFIEEWEVEEGSDIWDVVEKFLREVREYDDKDIEDVKDRIIKGDWRGCRWIKRGDRVIELDGGDVLERWELVG